MAAASGPPARAAFWGVGDDVLALEASGIATDGDKGMLAAAQILALPIGVLMTRAKLANPFFFGFPARLYIRLWVRTLHPGSVGAGPWAEATLGGATARPTKHAQTALHRI